MAQASEAVYRLKPVTYRYKKEIDSGQSPAFGLVAEDVAEVDPDLVARDAHGRPESVHYEMVNAMLLNEFLKEHRKVEEQQATIAKQRRDFQAAITQLNKQVETVVARLKEHDSKIQKVNDELELGRPALRRLANGQ